MITAAAWAKQGLAARQAALLTLVNGPWPPETDYINLVRTGGSWGVLASNGPNFNNAVFGRDSLAVADDLLLSHQSLAHDIILTLAKLQGRALDNQTEEEPGKIHHEYRAQHLIDDTREVPLTSLQRLVDLEHSWDIQGHDYLIYYGSYDSTPQYIRLVGRYVQVYGPKLLEESYTGRDNQVHTVADSARAALAWLVYKLENSASGLLEFKRLNKNALINQAWKDSNTAYLHNDGRPADGDRGIASAEIQGYAYDALLSGAQFFAEHNEQANYWRQLAQQLQADTLQKLWLPDEHYFAEGIDYGDDGRPEPIETLTSNGAALLASRLLLDLPAELKKQVVSNIARTIYSSEFVTDAGIRCRAVKHKGIPDFIDYHGTYTVWPKETHAIADGLRLHGLAALADQLDIRLLTSLMRAGDFYEFFYVEPEGKVWYDSADAITHFNQSNLGQDLPIPEPGQAWSISAALNILQNRQPTAANVQNPLEQSLLSSLPLINLPKDVSGLT